MCGVPDREGRLETLTACGCELHREAQPIVKQVDAHGFAAEMRRRVHDDAAIPVRRATAVTAQPTPLQKAPRWLFFSKLAACGLPAPDVDQLFRRQQAGDLEHPSHRRQRRFDERRERVTL
jgi:hypothetical protein